MHATGKSTEGAAWTCAYNNALVIANRSVVKTGNPSRVQTGDTLTFSLAVNNAGPAAVNGAILRDKPAVGLSCNAGVPIPMLPSGGQAVVTLVCTATASGQ